MTRLSWIRCAAAFGLVACSVQCSRDDASTAGPTASAESARRTDWAFYGGDPGGQRFTALDEIDAERFSQLEIAWRWPIGAPERRDAWMARHGVSSLRDAPSTNLFQLTPLVVAGVMYGAGPLGLLFALDAETGAVVWTNEDHVLLGPEDGRATSNPKSRGVAYWADGDDRRIVYATYDGRLVEVDAGTGETIESFGDAGTVDLLPGLRHAEDRETWRDFQVTSPVVVHGDTVVVGGAISDWGITMPGLIDDLRAFDVRTGEARWAFRLVPGSEDAASATWLDESWRIMGSANAWAPKSVDAERGWIYVGTSAPTSDFYGGLRPGDNLYADSLLCIDIATGELIWHFQVTHHGVWDYDLASPPLLLDLRVERDGRDLETGEAIAATEVVEAVALPTKQGFLFAFDRVTGEPLWPIEERPVPGTATPGERLSPTQPFPTRPPPFERQGLTEADLVDWTPALAKAARAAFDEVKSGPLYTPPGAERTAMSPGIAGGANWAGAAADPEHGVVFVPSVNVPMELQLVEMPPRLAHWKWLAPPPRQLLFAPPGHRSNPLPIVRPPWSQVSAIDLDTGELLWQSPLGEGPRSHPSLAELDLAPMGSGVMGCPVVTSTLLMVTEGHPQLRQKFAKNRLWAFDKDTGDIVGAVDLPGRPTGCPVSYLAGGRQYVAVGVVTDDVEPVMIALRLSPGS